jgi:fucose permease
MGLQDALGNAFITRLPGSSSKMSLAHAMYGFGAFVAPLVATQFAKEKMRGGWRFFYLVSLGVGLGNVACLAAVFRGKREERLFEEQGYRPVGDENDRMETPPMEIALRPTDQKPTGNSSSESNSQMKRIMSSPFIHLVAIFSWIYVGIEVTIGGWAVTFIIEARGGGDDSGYVSSGFFGGLMIGRVLQLAVGRWVSEHNIVFFYTAVALGLEIVSLARRFVSILISIWERRTQDALHFRSFGKPQASSGTQSVTPS